MGDLKQPAKIGAKDTSLVGMIIGAVWIAGFMSYKFISRPELITAQEVILSGLSLAAVFMPIYFSVLMDKIKEMKIGGGA